MKILKSVGCSIIFFLLLSTYAKAEVFYVTTQQEFDNAQSNAKANDSIVWRNGTYTDIFMEIEKDNLTIMAEELGKTIFTGESYVDIKSDNINFIGFQFLDGNIGQEHVINVRGSHVLITQINIRAYTSYKYLRVREESQYTTITYCNFENRLNLDDQNILSLLVDDTNPGYHKVQYCSFKNFDGTGNDLGIEPIRVGVSTQADFNSRCVVEYCYFTQCNGDGELISSKASQNVYRFNTFEDNPRAELVLRHGSESIVYGNFFLNGKGGVRVREGQDHYIYNNYFYEIDDRAIYIQNEDSDPLDNINIAFNTIVDCSEIRLGGTGNDKPTNVTFTNNIFSDPDDDLFEDATGTETWIGNIAFGDLGISVPSSGVSRQDPLLVKNSQGFFGLDANSPAIDAAQPGFASLPEFMGVENIDTDLLFDMMKQERPSSIAERDLGSNEYPHNVPIQPFATEENTGPDYNTSTTTSVQKIAQNVSDFLKVYPNPVYDTLTIETNNKSKARLKIDIFNTEGKMVYSIPTQTIIADKLTLSYNIGFFPAGIYTMRATIEDIPSGPKKMQSINFSKVE